jgi:hypothetical protein
VGARCFECSYLEVLLITPHLTIDPPLKTDIRLPAPRCLAGSKIEAHVGRPIPSAMRSRLLDVMSSLFTDATRSGKPLPPQSLRLGDFVDSSICPLEWPRGLCFPQIIRCTGCSTHPLASQFPVEIRLKVFESKSVYSTYSPSPSMHAWSLCNHS